MASLLADVTPLRRSPSFRRLWLGLTVSSVGNQLTVVGVAYQTYRLTHSTAMVGLVSLAALVPTLIGSIVGGVVADAIDRRRLLVVVQVLLACGSAGLAANTLLGRPQLWVLFVAPSVTAALQGVDWPTRLAAIPMLLPAEDLASAFALQSVVSNLAVVAGPALAGLLIARFGLASVYLVDVCSYGATFVAALMLPRLPPAEAGSGVGFGAIAEGFRYLRTQSLILATFVLDLNAMVFGMPKAVFPALGTGLFHGGPLTVGLLYAAPGAGALVASVLSGWLGAISARGRALVVCMLVWGGAITAFGFIPVLSVGLALLAVAGGADIIGGVFRVAILQTTTPTNLQGRLGGLFFAAAVSGNRLGDGESGLAASLGGPQFAVWSGGLACLVGTVLLAGRMPTLWRVARRGGTVDLDPAPAVAMLGAPLATSPRPTAERRSPRWGPGAVVDWVGGWPP